MLTLYKVVLKPLTQRNSNYRKISIDRPGGIHFLSTHNFWIIHKRTKIKTYSERVETFLSEYAFIFVLWQVVQKLCVEKKWIPPGLSIEILRYESCKGLLVEWKVQHVAEMCNAFKVIEINYITNYLRQKQLRHVK